MLTQNKCIACVSIAATPNLHHYYFQNPPKPAQHHIIRPVNFNHF